MKTFVFTNIKLLLLKLFSLIIVCFFVSCTEMRAQSGNKMPSGIDESFQQKYPGYKIKSWENKGNQYFIKFIQQRQSSIAIFSFDGKWIKTETIIKSTRQLTDSIRNAFNKSNYSSWYIVKITRCESPNTPIFYRFTVNNSNQLDGDHYAAFLKTYSLDVMGSHVGSANE
jgi:hypothetical protein